MPILLWVLSTDFAVTAAFACPFWTPHALA